MTKVLAKCLKTFPHEDDMQEYCDDKIKEPADVRIFHKGKDYPVVKEKYNKKYFKLIKPEVKVTALNVP